MSRLIDADELERHMRESGVLSEYYGDDEHAEDVINMIDEIPTASPRKGKWVLDTLGCYICSKCEHLAVWDYTRTQCLTNFCPNCGADMRGE